MQEEAGCCMSGLYGHGWFRGGRQGDAEGKKVRIVDGVVDGVKAGVGMLMALARGTF